LTATALALLPIFIPIVIGWLLQRFRFPGGDAWPALDRLAYFVLFPALLAHTLATADLSRLDATPLVAAVTASVMALALLVLLVGWKLVADAPAFTSVFQGSMRFNAYAGIAAAVALYGDDGRTVAAVVIAAMVPLANALSVIAHARHAGRDAPGLGAVALLMTTNPLIIGCAAGVALNLTGFRLPGVSGPALALLGEAAIPLGLLCVGASLDLGSISRTWKPVAATAGLKLFVLPVFTVVACTVFGVDTQTAKIAVLFSALPPASSSFILARQLGGDTPLLANMITVSTLASVGTLPLMLMVYG
jgi:malonate transporter